MNETYFWFDHEYELDEGGIVRFAHADGTTILTQRPTEDVFSFAIRCGEHARTHGLRLPETPEFRLSYPKDVMGWMKVMVGPIRGSVMSQSMMVYGHRNTDTHIACWSREVDEGVYSFDISGDDRLYESEDEMKTVLMDRIKSQGVRKFLKSING